MTPDEISEKARRAVEAVRRVCQQPQPFPPPKPVELLDRGTMGTMLRCPGCGERMAAISHSELVDEHFGCAGCGRVYYECDGRLWPCKFPQQDVPGWRLKHELPGEAQTEPPRDPKGCKHDFRTPTASGGAG
jgi:hypothetical protein